MKLASWIGFRRAEASGHTYRVSSRMTGEDLDGEFVRATRDNVESAARLAARAFAPYRDLGGARHASFLRTIAEALEGRRSELVSIAGHETALPDARLNGELTRTTNQLRMFARIAEDGSWQDIRIAPALLDRTPPAPEMRSMLRPLGPVAIFGASNFPFAFSVAGGDTVSALAAGCSVIVKAHPAHPGTSDLAAQAMVEAAQKEGLPDGVFSMLFDDGFSVGEALVKHPLVAGVGFTGSRRGGLALWKLANARETPIPVYAEMGSINPVVVLPGKLNAEFAGGLHASVTMGVGQFCTNPGLILAVGDSAEFRRALAQNMSSTAPCPMLTDSIAENYVQGVLRIADAAGIEQPAAEAGAPIVIEVDLTTFLREPRLQEEVFGPSTVVVTCATKTEAIRAIDSLEGQLTGSIHGSDTDLAQAIDVVQALESKVGRLIVNQFPTGLEVNDATVHGGPHPATTDSRTTSVGGRAILRWARPVCYQNFPKQLLPAALSGTIG